MTARLSPQREAEIVEHLAGMKNFSFGNLAARDLAAELAAVRAERDEAELMRDFTDFHLRQLSDQRGEAESANEAWELGKITAEEALRRTDAAIQNHKTVTLDQFRAEREARS